MKPYLQACLIALILFQTSCSQNDQVLHSDQLGRYSQWKIYFREDFSSTLKDQILFRFKEVVGEIQVLSRLDLDQLQDQSTVIVVGSSKNDLSLPEEFVVRSSYYGSARVVEAYGNHILHDRAPVTNIGSVFAVYKLLELCGFGFLHPFETIVPEKCNLPSGSWEVRESPHWNLRGLHLHTMHPIELTHVLNGWGDQSPDDESGWKAMLPKWQQTLEWLIANRQNYVQWVLLESKDWIQFSDSKERQNRLRTLVEMAHDWGLLVGIDVPLVLAQQNSWRLVKKIGTEVEIKRQIQKRVDYVLDPGFDFISTELGLSEFTHPGAKKMLNMLNWLTEYVVDQWGREVKTKAHISTDQKAEGFRDPETNASLNFNFLPYYADRRLGVLPHTVQVFALDDPVDTYGQTSFSEMRRYMQMEAGRRKVYWYPESAYWVSYDIDVPLYLPLYAKKRFHDLRLIAQDERDGRMGRGDYAGSRIDGQIIFSSGWEWGYWLNDVVSMRAAWNPYLELSEEEALMKHFSDFFRHFGESQKLSQFFIRLTNQLDDLLVQGKIDGKIPKKIKWRSGHAYLQGHETWDDIAGISELIQKIPLKPTQPVRVGPVDIQQRFRIGPSYLKVIRPLQYKMASSFYELWSEFKELRQVFTIRSKNFSEEIEDGLRINYLRAAQIAALYDFASRYRRNDKKWKKQRLRDSQLAVDEALSITAKREQYYRMDPDLIAGWRSNPTSYEFAYLWTARTLFYWLRDEGKAVNHTQNFCYLNIIDPFKVAFAEDHEHISFRISDFLTRKLGVFNFMKDCVSPPVNEPDILKRVRE